MPRKKIEIRIVNDNNEDETNKPAINPSIELSPRPAIASSMRKSRTSIVSLAHHQLRRRESALSLFALTASAEQKRIGIGMDYLNQLYEEKLRDQNELSSLMQSSSRIVKQQQQAAINRTPSGSFSLISSSTRNSATNSSIYLPRRMSNTTTTLAQSTNHLLAKEEMDAKRSAEQQVDESLTVYNVFFLLFKALNFIILLLVRAGFVSKRVLKNLKQNFKIYLFIFILFSVILAAVFFSLLKLFNKLKNRL